MDELTREEIVRQRNMDFLITFTSEAGKRVLEYLSKYCLENNPTFVEQSERKTSFNEGARAVILEIRRWLNMNIDKVLGKE